MTKRSRNQLLLGTALALSFAAAAPAAANEITPGEGETLGRPIGPVDDVESDDDRAGPGGSIRPFDIEVRLEPMAAKGGKGGGSIRPFAGNMLPNSGKIRSFAGPVVGTSGKIRSFQGELTESSGKIRSFAGAIETYSGKIRSFQTEVNPLTGYDKSFWGTLAPRYGSLAATSGKIRSFAGDFEIMSGKIRSFEGGLRDSFGALYDYNEATGTYQGLHDAIQNLVNSSKTTFGTAIENRTGQSYDVFARNMLDRYDIKLGSPSSVAGLNELGLELFLLDWYDNLMNYSGQDMVDHWMKQVNWSPALTQGLDRYQRTRIGVLDFMITGDDFGNVVNASGGFNVAGIHGSAVASLIAARHDGKGVMGIAPGAYVFGYNPFDSTNTAGWTDVRKGVESLLWSGASVINMSLGVPGKVLDSGWTTEVFGKIDPLLRTQLKNSVFVIAAGNEGITHHKDQKPVWNFETNPNIILVGSVDPNNRISTFSNRPGEAQLDKKAGNDPLGTDKLRDRFMVAPGEFMLVSDGKGGVTRMSGTSFAAPLVSGTIALVHARWPWLADNPQDTVNLILNSTDDLGAAGTDDVYGRGMLNVSKALAPGNWWALKWSRIGADGTETKMDANYVLETSQTTISSWGASGGYFYLFEDFADRKGKDDRFRDFAVPLDSKLIGTVAGRTGEQFDAYLQSGFWGWWNTNKKTAKRFTTPHFSASMGELGGLETEVVAVPRTWRPGLRQSSVPYDTGLALRSGDGRVAMRFGSGAGAGFVGQQGFGLQSDYDVLTGGANPFMGLASGAAYGAVELAIGPKVTVSTGVSRQEAVFDFDRMSPEERRTLGGMDPYRATANNLTVTYRANDRFSANIGYTMLNEDSALLGVRSLDPVDFADGTTTDATTLGATYATPSGLSLAMSGTMGRTRPGGLDGQAMAVGKGGLISSAWQVAVAKQGIFGDDRLRVSFAQPLHVERGSIDYSVTAVVDRNTGEIGTLVQSLDAERGRRNYVAETMYGRSFLDGVGQFNLFGRANLRGEDGKQAAVMAGGNVRLAF